MEIFISKLTRYPLTNTTPAFSTVAAITFSRSSTTLLDFGWHSLTGEPLLFSTTHTYQQLATNYMLSNEDFFLYLRIRRILFKLPTTYRTSTKILLSIYNPTKHKVRGMSLIYNMLSCLQPHLKSPAMIFRETALTSLYSPQIGTKHSAHPPDYRG